MDNVQSARNPLGTERIGRLVLQFALPSVISLIVSSLYNMVDQVFIGNSVGYQGNAATNVILPITFIMLAIGLMLGNGTAAYMSLELGKGNPEKAEKGVGTMITLTLIAGIAALVFFESFLRPVCELFGGEGAVLEYAMDYGRIIVVGLPFYTMGTSFGAVIRADGRPKQSMAGMLIGCITNIILDPIFIFIFHWGVKGAAAATIIGQILNAAYYVLCMRRFDTIKLKKKDLIPKARVAATTMTLGLSSFLTQISSVIVMILQNNLLVSLGNASIYGGDVTLAAFSITMKTSQLIMCIALGISTGVQPIYGFNYGSGQYDRVKRTFFTALISCTAVMFVALFAFQVFPEYIVLIFGQESELYMQFAVKCFRIYLRGVFMIPAGLVVGNFFQSTGRAVPATLLSLSRQVIILIPATLIFSSIMGVEGVLWAGMFSDIASGVVALIAARILWNSIFMKTKVSTQ